MRDPRVEPRAGDIVRLTGGPMAAADGVEFVDIRVDDVFPNAGYAYVFWQHLYPDGSRGSLAATPLPWWINDGESLFVGAAATIIHAEGE